MPHPFDPPPSDPDLPIDQRVRDAFSAWDACHADIAMLRRDYDVAIQRFERGDGPDPAALRARLKALQSDGDQLFFLFLRLAEARSRDRYI